MHFNKNPTGINRNRSSINMNLANVSTNPLRINANPTRTKPISNNGRGNQSISGERAQRMCRV